MPPQVFICGPSPHWLLVTARGALRLHPMSIDGPVDSFAPFHNINCPKGFLYFNRQVWGGAQEGSQRGQGGVGGCLRGGWEDLGGPRGFWRVGGGLLPSLPHHQLPQGLPLLQQTGLGGARGTLGGSQGFLVGGLGGPTRFWGGRECLFCLINCPNGFLCFSRQVRGGTGVSGVGGSEVWGYPKGVWGGVSGIFQGSLGGAGGFGVSGRVSFIPFHNRQVVGGSPGSPRGGLGRTPEVLWECPGVVQGGSGGSHCPDRVFWGVRGVVLGGRGGLGVLGCVGGILAP